MRRSCVKMRQLHSYKDRVALLTNKSTKVVITEKIVGMKLRDSVKMELKLMKLKNVLERILPKLEKYGPVL